MREGGALFCAIYVISFSAVISSPQVHDQLVDVERVDPSSDIYYMELELRTAAKFPDRWAAIQKEQAEAAAAKLPPPASSTAANAFGRALRVTLKDAIPSASHFSSSPGKALGSPSPPVHGFMNINAAAASPSSSGSAGGGGMAAARMVGVGSGAGSKVAARNKDGPASSISPLRSPVPPSGGSVGGSRQSSRQSNSPAGPFISSPGPKAAGQRNASLIKQIRDAAELPSSSSFEPLSYEQMQQEYLRQRAAVVEELNRAKAQVGPTVI